MSILQIVLVFIGLVIAYLWGRINNVKNIEDKEFGGILYEMLEKKNRELENDLYNLKYRTLEYNYSVSGQILNEQLYRRGYYEGFHDANKQNEKYDFKTPTEQEKFIKRFSTAMTPLEEMKKDLEKGKF